MTLEATTLPPVTTVLAGSGPGVRIRLKTVPDTNGGDLPTATTVTVVGKNGVKSINLNSDSRIMFAA